MTWRCLWCVIGVLVGGCSGVSQPASRTPMPTLWGYTFVPLTATPIGRLLRPPTLARPAPGTTRPGVAPLTLGASRCYETPPGALWCLGLIQNLLSYPVEGVSIRVILLDAAGNMLAMLDVPSARLFIPPGAESPYGALFPQPPSGFESATAELLSAQAMDGGQHDWAVLTVNSTDIAMTTPGAARSVTLTVTNSAEKPIAHGQLVVYFVAEDGQVVGFRQTDLIAPLPSGSTQPYTMFMMPFTAERYTVRMAADARLGS